MKNAFLGILFIFYALYSAGQTDTITTRVITFDGDFATEAPANAKSKFYRNVIKVNPFLIIVGDIPLYYERSLNSKFSVEMGLGMTTKNYVYSWFNDEYTVGIPDEQIEHRAGVTFKSGLRYYPQGYAPEDVYFAFEHSYRRYNLEYAELADYGTPSGSTFKTSRVINEIKAIVGNQKEYYYNDGFFWEYYAGIGLRFVDDVIVTQESETVSGGTNFTYDLEPQSNMTPSFYLGLKFGVAF